MTIVFAVATHKLVGMLVIFVLVGLTACLRRRVFLRVVNGQKG